MPGVQNAKAFSSTDYSQPHARCFEAPLTEQKPPGKAAQGSSPTLGFVGIVQARFLRPNMPKPIRPVPSRAIETGSGTGTGMPAVRFSLALWLMSTL